MAFVPMTAGGGSMSETTLWTNPSPTANFNAQNVTLSDDITNYDYIVIDIRSGSDDIHLKYYYTPAELVNYTSSAMRPLIGELHTNNYYYYRSVTYNSSTSLAIGACIRNTASSAASTNNGGILPQTIKGIKYA